MNVHVNDKPRKAKQHTHKLHVYMLVQYQTRTIELDLEI